ncbi:MAG TPA: formylglycine-generating enzyme family protein [Verrucomicrobiota bacterium]|nr:hypothetical protein [Verrucomicrobiales bacterium]HRI15877.1 formylglycine-generating enzyme family protein [Verrucomicrobiota bacterium]
MSEQRTAPRVDQSQQAVTGSQTNVAGDLIQHFPSSDQALATLSQRLKRVRRTRAEELRAITLEFGDPRSLDRLYVVPDLQDFNPPEEYNNPGLIVSRQPAFDTIDAFLRRPNLGDNGHRVLFVLGDAGMGKTSLLLMLKFRHLTSLLPGSGSCELMKLGPDTVKRIQEVPDPSRTLLLLDSLDEDPEAHRDGQGSEARLSQLLPLLRPFHRTILTCRTQFFPENSSHLTTLKGHFVVGAYECPLKYMSLFDDRQVEQCLRRRYHSNWWQRLVRRLTTGNPEDPRLNEARAAAQAMESLRLRPLLLSHIESFVSTDGQPVVDFRNRYAVFHRLVDQWLMRDATKPLGLPPDQSWRVATQLALHLARLGRRHITGDELAEVEVLKDVGRFQIESRSLINRIEARRFQFAHATIPEFLLARALLEWEPGFAMGGVGLSRGAWNFLTAGKKLMSRTTVHLRGVKLDFASLEAAVEWAREEIGFELASIPSGGFEMGSPPTELGRTAYEKLHRVTLTHEFWLGRYPVTQGEYAAVMGNNPSHFKGERRPVENVSWEEATEFCRRLTQLGRDAGVLGPEVAFRLPTEAEWEYACRAGTTGAFNNDSECTMPAGKDPALEQLGWYDKNSGNETHLVGEKEPNRWGLYDMHGNVWEWCLDRAEWSDGVVTNTYVEGIQDPVCWEGAGRVVRGGGYWADARLCRSADRLANGPILRGVSIGFRLAAGQQLADRSGAPVPEAPAGRPVLGAEDNDRESLWASARAY